MTVKTTFKMRRSGDLNPTLLLQVERANHYTIFTIKNEQNTTYKKKSNRTITNTSTYGGILSER